MLHFGVAKYNYYSFEEDKEKDNEKSKLGVYYTPKDLAEYIVIESLFSYFNEIDSTLGDKIRLMFLTADKNKKNISLTNVQKCIIKERIKKIKVLDLCCGCGQLIISFLKYIDCLITTFKVDIGIKDFIEFNISAIDIDKVATNILKLRLLFYCFLKTNNNMLIDFTNILLNDALDVGNYKGKKYDIVMSNPPYVSKSNFQKKIITERELINEYYDRYLNLYGYFFLVGINVLKEKGILAFLNPNTLLTEGAFKRIREAIYLNTRVIEVLELPINYFEKNVKSIIIILTNLRELEYNVLEKKLKDGNLYEIYNSLNVQKFKPNSVFKYNYEIRFYPENIDRIISKIKRNCKYKISDYLKPIHGLNKISNSSMIIGSDKSINKYFIDSKYTINDELENIPKYYFYNKIIVKRRGQKEFKFALDIKKIIWKSNIIILYPKDYTNYIDIEFFLGLLNSKLIEFWLKYHASHPKEEYNLTNSILEDIPVKYDSNLSRRVISKIKELLNCKDLNIAQEIDQLIYKLYELSSEDINIIENNI